ncbi:MAG: sulfurtransferase TusA family protein [Pseudomonadota bacterium]
MESKETVLDVRGTRCPIPVLKARKRMAGLPSDGLVTIISDDPLSQIDVPNFCREDGHVLMGTVPGKDGAVSFCIQKG